MSERSRFVERHFAHRCQAFERIAFAHKNPVLGHVADGRHNGGRRSQNQSARAEYDQDSDRSDDLARDHPGAASGRQRHDDDPRSPAVGQPNDLGFARVGRFHQADHAGERAVLANALGAHLERSELVHRTAFHLVARCFVHGKRLAGHHRFVNGSAAADHGAVDRYRFSWKHAHNVSSLHVLGGDGAHVVSVHDTRRSRGQFDQALDACPCFRYRQLLQKRAKLHDEGDFARGEILADGHRGDERHGNKDVGFDIELGDQAYDRADHDGRAA